MEYHMADHHIALRNWPVSLFLRPTGMKFNMGRGWTRSLWQLRKTQLSYVTSPSPKGWTGNNWAVLVETSKYWYNYRHAANASGLRNGGCWSHFDEAGKTKEIREEKMVKPLGEASQVVVYNPA